MLVVTWYFRQKSPVAVCCSSHQEFIILTVCLCILCSDTFIIFSGGMPRASHGVRHTVSVLHGAHDHVVFDVTSKVVDFLVLCNGDKNESSAGNGPLDNAVVITLVSLG